MLDCEGVHSIYIDLHCYIDGMNDKKRKNRRRGKREEEGESERKRN